MAPSLPPFQSTTSTFPPRMSYDPIPLVDMDSSTMDPLPKRRKPRSTTSSSSKRFLFSLALLLTFGIVSFFAWTRGIPFVKRLAKMHDPHSAQKVGGEVLPESEVVRSLFGLKEEKSIVSFDLVASVFFIDRGWNDRREPISNANESSSSNSSQETSSSIARPWFNQEPKEWERVFSQKVFTDLDVKLSRNRKATVNITLPARIVSAIQRGSHGIELVASFQLQPSSPSSISLIPLNTTNYLQSIMTTMKHLWYQPERYPLPYPAVGTDLSEQHERTSPWESRIAGTPVIHLLRHVSPLGAVWMEPKPEPENDEDVEEDDGSSLEDYFDSWTEQSRNMIASRSMITLVRDFPTYSLTKFKRKQNVLKNRKMLCLKGISQWDGCQRSFKRHGHFEDLMEMGSLDDLAELEENKVDNTSKREPKGWRYIPYVLANYGGSGLKDFVEMPKKSNSTTREPAQDWSFNWHLSFATTSRLKFTLTSEYLDDGRRASDFVIADGDHVLAAQQDGVDLLNAFIGHPFDPNSRPILRFILRHLSNLLFYASILLSGHYWFTRSYSTGISISAYAIDTLVRLVLFFITIIGFRKGEVQDFATVPVVLFAASLVWTLAAKLEWRWSGWAPVGVTRRRDTHAERASSRLDFKFGWSQRALATALAYLAFLYLPFLPDLISASPPTNPSLTPGSLSYPHDPSSTSLTRFIKPTYHTSRFVVFLAQSLLNHRSKTYGGSYKIVAFLEFGSEVLASLPIVLSSRWGRWELMDPWKITNLVEVLMRGVLVWQAWTLERVRQEDEEGEEE